MRFTRALGAAAVVVVLAACGGQEDGPAAGGLASYAGVLGCADVVAWGTVQGRVALGEGVQVTLEVQEWIVPDTGASSASFVADDEGEVGAPAWPVTQDRLLVVLSEAAPPTRLDPVEGERAVQQWRDAGSPLLDDDRCARA